jgi:diguanylate cyclase (GGDEF)-like protein
VGLKKYFLQVKKLINSASFGAVVLLPLLLISTLLSANSGAETEKPLRVANSKAWIPFSYLGENGEPKGILIDFWNEYGKSTGREIEFILTDWNESVDMVKRGEADVHAGMLWSEKREGTFDFADTFTSITTHLYFDHHIANVDVDSFLAGSTGPLGLVYGGYEQDFIESNYPNVKLALFSNNEEMLEAAFNHNIEAFVADLQVANFYLQTSNKYNSKSNPFIPVRYLYTGNVRPAVLEGNVALLSEVTKAFQPIIYNDKDRILNRWINTETVYPPYLIPIMFGFIFLITVTYIVQLNKTVKSKTQALQLANEQLFILSQIDELTKIYNRRYFMDTLRGEVSQQTDIAVLVFDIDDFKQFNDNYGHTAGDKVIRKVVDKINEMTPDNYLFARIGGEEFALYLSNEPFDHVIHYANSLCEAVNSIDLTPLRMKESVSISLGVAYYPTAPVKLRVHDADLLMYQAKAAGKNRAIVKRL